MTGILSKAETLRAIQRLDPYEFERYVADLWERRGFETELRKQSGDRGIDIEAVRTDAGVNKELIQVKRYKPDNKIGSQTVREYATLYQQVNDAYQVTIVTSGYFTHDAKQLARELNVNTVDGDALFEIANANADISAEYLYNADKSQHSSTDSNHQVDPDPKSEISGGASLPDLDHPAFYLILGLAWLIVTGWVAQLLIPGPNADGPLVWIVWVIIQVVLFGAFVKFILIRNASDSASGSE